MEEQMYAYQQILKDTKKHDDITVGLASVVNGLVNDLVAKNSDFIRMNSEQRLYSAVAKARMLEMQLAYTIDFSHTPLLPEILPLDPIQVHALQEEYEAQFQ